MKHTQKNLIGLGLAVLVLCGAISQDAWARGRFHSNFVFFVGTPWYWWPEPYYYPPYYSPYYYPSPVSRVYIEEQPPVYIQRNDTGPTSAAPPANYWYYCQNPQGYYPYVKECPPGWMQVVPQSPPNR